MANKNKKPCITCKEASGLIPDNPLTNMALEIVRSLTLDGISLYTDGESILFKPTSSRQINPAEQMLLDKYKDEIIPLLAPAPKEVGIPPQVQIRKTVNTHGITGVVSDSVYSGEPFFDIVNTWNGETGDISFNDYVNTVGTILEDYELLQDQPGNRFYWIAGKNNSGSSFGHTQSPESIYEEEWWGVINYSSSGNTAPRFPVAYGWNWGGGSGSSLDPVPGWTKAKYAGVVNHYQTDPQYAMQWKVINDNLYAVDQTIKPSEGGTYDLGSLNNKWKSVYCEQLFADTLDSISFNSIILENDELLQDQPAGQSYWIAGNNHSSGGHDQSPPSVDGETWWNVVNYNSSDAYHKARFPIARGWNGSSDGGWTKTQYSGRGSESSWSSGDIFWKLQDNNLLSVDSDIIPDGDETRTLGSDDNKWKDLYVGSGTIHVGDAEIKSDGTEVVVSELKIGTKDSNISLQKSGNQLKIMSGLSSSSVDGAAGPTGSIGATGATGEKGSTGATGPQGVAGPVGNYVSHWNGITSGGVTTSSLVVEFAGISSGGGATFGGKVIANQVDAAITATALNVGGYYAFPVGAGGATGDVLMIDNDGDLEFSPFRTTATFIVDSDIPLATGIRYKGLYAVPLPKMDVVSIELRSHDVSPAGSGDSLSVALKFIRTGLESASPTIQGTVETVAIPLGGEYHTAVSEGSIGTGLLESYEVGSDNAANYLVVDVVSNAGNHTNFTMLVTMEARP